MCNAYKIGPDAGRQQSELVARVVALLPSREMLLIRKTDTGPVVLPSGEAKMMRWGFYRNFNNAINNTRSDKLGDGMWKEAFEQRHCLIPMSIFYEWTPGVGGKNKQAYEFRDIDGGYLWIAGVWEEHPDLGPCYSMLTTDAGPAMAAIHDRTPAVLESNQADHYLAGNLEPPQPYKGPILVRPCPSPLAKPKPSNGQGELF
jgi:putative SOS response-associated peptidase YedK